MRSKLDGEMRADYWKKFEDGSPQRWSVNKSGDAWTLGFPNGAVQNVSRSEPKFDWMGQFAVDSDSTRLWFNSLRYLVDIIDEGDVVFAISALESFHAHQLEYRDRPREVFSGSIDHQCALQLRTCCEVSAWQAQNPDLLGVEENLALDALLGGIVANIRNLVNELDLLQPNNHGIMLGIAALHSSYFFPEPTETTDEQATYVDFLYNSLSSILGSDGLADENTVIYQAFYVRLLSEITRFLDWVSSNSSTKFILLSELASTALSQLLLPNNDVPPIGDGVGAGQSKHKSTPGTWQSRENGIFVHSTNSSYVSFICGFRGVFHKQMDDTSLIVWHNGKYLIQDAGLASYDKKDKIAVSLRTQLGHSGLFFEEFDDVLAEKVVSYGARTRLVQSRMSPFSQSNDGSLTVKGVVDFRRTRVERTLTLIGENTLYIRDVVQGNSEAKSAVSRFLLDPKADVSFNSDGSVIVRNGGSWLRLSSNNGLQNAVVYRGDDRNPDAPRGFLAPRNYSTVPTTLLEFPIKLDSTGRGKHSLRLEFGSD